MYRQAFYLASIVMMVIFFFFIAIQLIMLIGKMISNPETLHFPTHVNIKTGPLRGELDGLKSEITGVKDGVQNISESIFYKISRLEESINNQMGDFGAASSKIEDLKKEIEDLKNQLKQMEEEAAAASCQNEEGTLELPDQSVLPVEEKQLIEVRDL